jgi:hypothetical protein
MYIHIYLVFFVCLKTGSCSSQKYFIDVNESLSMSFLSECLGLCQVTSVSHSRLHNAVKTHQAVLKQLCEHIRLYSKRYFVPPTVIQQHTYTHFVSHMLFKLHLLVLLAPEGRVSFFFFLALSIAVVMGCRGRLFLYYHFRAFVSNQSF